jgi:Mn2+/Fe2+ NRAMP family transporter
VGVAMLIAITLFQASNNNALLMAAEGFIDDGSEASGLGLSPLMRTVVLLLVNLGVISLLMLGKRNLYRSLERSMAVLVGLMVVAFGLTMIVAGPSLLEIAKGLIPGFPVLVSSKESGSGATSWMSVGALMATTFSVAGAFYQAYQVREKGWAAKDLQVGVTDSIVGIGTLAAITAMILVTAASALHGKVDPSELTDAAAVAVSLEPLFGSWAKIVFAAGVLAGAVSSFVVNALIGGVVFSDAIGLGSRFSSLPVRMTTIAALLLGWFVASMVTFAKIDLVSFIVIAQALTVLAFPILAAVILWQLHLVKGVTIPVWVKPLCWAGMLVVVALSVRTVLRLL